MGTNVGWIMIDTLKEIVIESPAFYIGWGGLLIGIVFGFIVYRTNFCTMGSISDIMSFGDFRRFRSWMLAVAVAILGVALLQAIGVADMANSMYLSPNFGWLGNVVGGLMFGFGMVFSGGCISRNLVRAGSGDLRSVVILLVTGLFAFMTIGGLLGPARVAIFGPATVNLGDLNMATQGAGEFLYLLELPHGYTYSAHPLACAAGLASLDILANDNLAERVKSIAPYFQEALHGLKGCNHITDIRNYGLAGALTIEAFGLAENCPQPALRPYQIAMKMWQKGFYVRYGGDTIQLGLPFTSELTEIDSVINALGETLKEIN